VAFFIGAWVPLNTIIMTVKFVVSIAGKDFSYRPGEVAIIADTLALAWVDSGVCELLASQEKVAVKPKPSKKDN
jgi:hypothetical protein